MAYNKVPNDTTQINKDVSLEQYLASKIHPDIDAVVIAEDSPFSLFGIIQLTQKITQGKTPMFIAVRADQLIHIHKANQHSQCFYILDNNYPDKPKGVELIEKFGIEDRCVLVTSEFSDPAMHTKKYPVYDKIIPDFD